MTRRKARTSGNSDLALVVFSGQTDLWRLRVLKPGFRHCFVVLGNDDRWVVYNPLSHQTDIAILDGVTVAELIALFCRHGHKVLPCAVPKAPLTPAPLAPFTCVEAVKRVLGIHAIRVITPWNLYRFLLRKK